MTGTSRFVDRRVGGRRHGFTLIESMIAVAVAALVISGTITLLTFARSQNEREQERLRAHQIVSEALELERYQLFTWTQSQTTRMIWDNATPDNPDDDTTGQLEVIVTDPETGAVLTTAPDPARLVVVEATVSWTPRGARFAGETLRETVMTFKVP